MPITCDAAYDAAMAAVDSMVDPASLSESAEHTRALISRFDGITHYRAAHNLELILGAIGTGSYPGYPAVDVLTRAWEVDDERRATFAGWARGLEAWAHGEQGAVALPGGKTTNLESLLGERTVEKAWLAASLAETLKYYSFTAQDRLEALDDEVFVRAVYRAALGREPSADDLGFRLRELREGKTRAAFVEEVHASDEAHKGRMWRVLESAHDLDHAH